MIKLKNSEEIETMAASGRILAKAIRVLQKKIKRDVSLRQLDDLTRKFIEKNNAEPAFLGHRPDGARHPYPHSICASVNNVIVHGRPSDYKLQSGDVLKIDLGVRYKGFCSDAAFTTIIDKGTREAENLVKATKRALDEAIKRAKTGNYLGDIGWAIEKTAKKFGVKVVKQLTGHGIGKELHEEPTIYNFGEKGRGVKLKPGMVLAIEPMFSIGSGEIIQLNDESWATSDGSLSAHFEHTVAVTEKEPKILTAYH